MAIVAFTSATISGFLYFTGITSFLFEVPQLRWNACGLQNRTYESARAQANKSKWLYVPQPLLENHCMGQQWKRDDVPCFGLL
jgi:hypothetical protein